MTDVDFKSPRLAKRGDVVIVPLQSGGEVEEVVRGVDIILHLANGQDVVVPTNEPLRFVTPESISAEVLEVLSEMQSE